MARAVSASPRPTDSRKPATVSGKRYQLLGAGVCRSAPRSHSSARSSGAGVQPVPEPRARSAAARARRRRTPPSAGPAHRGGPDQRPGLGVVPPGGAGAAVDARRRTAPASRAGPCPSAPATRKAASEERAGEPSSPSERTPDRDGGPAGRAGRGRGWRTARRRRSSPSAAASQCARVYPVCGLRWRGRRQGRCRAGEGGSCAGTIASRFAVVRDGRSRRPRPSVVDLADREVGQPPQLAALRPGDDAG